MAIQGLSEKRFTYEFYNEIEGENIYYDVDNFTVKIRNRNKSIYKTYVSNEITHAGTGKYEFILEFPEGESLIYLELGWEKDGEKDGKRIPFSVPYANSQVDLDAEDSDKSFFFDS